MEQDTVATSTSPSTTPTETTPAATETEPEPEERTETEEPGSGGTGGAAPGEEQEGGAGDELEASSQALFTGRGGRIRPTRVRVPPFIAIRVELRSADGRPYGLRFGKRAIVVGGRRKSASLTLEGMRPGRRLRGSGSARVVIEASAEPGP